MVEKIRTLQQETRLKRRKNKLHAWLDEHRNRKVHGIEFHHNSDLSDKIGVPTTIWSSQITGRAFPKSTEYDAKVFAVTGIAEFDPRTTPAKYRGRALKWTQQQYVAFWAAWTGPKDPSAAPDYVRPVEVEEDEEPAPPSPPRPPSSISRRTRQVVSPPAEAPPIPPTPPIPQTQTPASPNLAMEFVNAGLTGLLNGLSGHLVQELVRLVEARLDQLPPTLATQQPTTDQQSEIETWMDLIGGELTRFSQQVEQIGQQLGQLAALGPKLDQLNRQLASRSEIPRITQPDSTNSGGSLQAAVGVLMRAAKGTSSDRLNFAGRHHDLLEKIATLSSAFAEGGPDLDTNLNELRRRMSI